MTHLMQLPFSLRARLSTGLLMSLLILCAGVLVTGCGEEKKPEPVKKETRAYTPPPVQARTIADLMTEYGIDDRVYMSEDKAPSSEKEKIALLKFFDAWVRGNHEYVIEVLGTADQPQLMAMVQEGQWDCFNRRCHRQRGVADGTCQGWWHLCSGNLRAH